MPQEERAPRLDEPGGSYQLADGRHVFKPRPGIHAVAAAIGHVGWELRRNTRTGGIEYQNPRSDSWRQLDEMARINLEAEIEAKCAIQQSNAGITHFSPTKDKWQNGLEYSANLLCVDPFREWLETLPAVSDTSEPELPVSSCFTTPDIIIPASTAATVEELEAEERVYEQIIDFENWVNRYPFWAAIAKAYYPECKAHVCLVLIGAQGIGKSTFWQLALPAEHRGEWVTDGIQLDGSNREFAESCGNAVFGEIAELTGAGSRARREHIKQVMTSGGMNIRFSYRHNAVTWYPKLVFLGSSNSQAPLPADPTGNRRFLALRVKKIRAQRKPATNLQQLQHINRWWDRNRNEIWAAAAQDVHQAAKENRLNQLLAIPPDLEWIQREFNRDATPETDALARTRKYAHEQVLLPDIELVHIWTAPTMASGFDQTGPIPAHIQVEMEQALTEVGRKRKRLPDGRTVWSKAVNNPKPDQESQLKF